jgi:hypothetical protein
MSVLFSTQVGTYLSNAREREPAEVLALRGAFEQLDRNGEGALAKMPHRQLHSDTYILNIGGFILTLVKRPNGDLHVTNITKGMLDEEFLEKAG